MYLSIEFFPRFCAKAEMITSVSHQESTSTNLSWRMTVHSGQVCLRFLLWWPNNKDIKFSADQRKVFFVKHCDINQLGKVSYKYISSTNLSQVIEIHKKSLQLINNLSPCVVWAGIFCFALYVILSYFIDGGNVIHLMMNKIKNNNVNLTSATIHLSETRLHII